ncbi:MAG: aldehyde dehydrogenase family protein [Spirochaetaceae bacterium]
MKMFIAGEWTDASDLSETKIVDTANGEIIDTVPSATTDDIVKAIESAKQGRINMQKTPAHVRSKILLTAAELIEKDHEELSQLLTRENGKPIIQTREEISATIRLFKGFSEEAKRLTGQTVPMDSVPSMENSVAMTIRQPVGIVAAVIPFNYPAELFAHKAPAAIAAGNAVIIQPPTTCPLTILRLSKYLEEAGLPKFAQQVITGDGAKIGNHLAKDINIQLITLTGSTRVGQQVAKLATSNMKKVLLELGGNDATIVCADADLELASEGIIMGRLARGNGQICCAVKRVIVASEIFEKFTNLLTEKANKLIMGNPLGENTDVGPLISENAAKNVERLIEDAKSKGCTIRLGGNRKGSFIEPTIITDIDPETEIFAEETFGPVLPIVPFSTIEEAVKIANNSPYGLQAAVFTKDINTAMDISYKLDVGGVVINWGSAVRAENLPFGGTKLSGVGRESIRDTILEMTEQKTIIIKDALKMYS